MPELTLSRHGDALIVQGRASYAFILVQAVSIPLLAGGAMYAPYPLLFSEVDVFLKILVGAHACLAGWSSIILLRRFSWSWRAEVDRRSETIRISEKKFCWTRARTVDVARVDAVGIHHLHWAGEAENNTNSLELKLTLSPDEAVIFGEPWLCTDADFPTVALEAEKMADVIRQEIFGPPTGNAHRASRGSCIASAASALEHFRVGLNRGPRVLRSPRHVLPGPSPQLAQTLRHSGSR